MRIKAVFFDLDETLLDGIANSRSIPLVCREIASRCPGLTPERLLEANDSVWASYWPKVEPGWTLGRLNTADISLAAWQRSLNLCGIDDESLAHHAYETHSRLAREAHRLFDDVPDVLRQLSGTMPIAVITNGASDTQREKLRATGIEHLFDAIIVSGELGIAKPEAAIFETALESTGVSAPEALHVGDNLRLDVLGALNAGLTAVWLNLRGATREDSHPTPHHEIAASSDLLGLL